MYILERNNTSPLCVLCTLMPQIISLLTLPLLHMWYGESTPWAGSNVFSTIRFMYLPCKTLCTNLITGLARHNMFRMVLTQIITWVCKDSPSWQTHQTSYSIVRQVWNSWVESLIPLLMMTCKPCIHMHAVPPLVMSLFNPTWISTYGAENGEADNTLQNSMHVFCR